MLLTVIFDICKGHFHTWSDYTVNILRSFVLCNTSAVCYDDLEDDMVILPILDMEKRT